jgi:hypothetical protein
MMPFRSLGILWCVVLMASAGWALADGMVFPEAVHAKVEIPDQQALIHFSGGTQRLVIETSFVAEGTNFAWVVPLPSTPLITPVSADFFQGLQYAFQPELVHNVRPYYAGILFVLGLAFLGARGLKDEVSWLSDVPLCLLMGLGAALVGKHYAYGVVAAGFALGMRTLPSAPTNYALTLLTGTGFAVFLTFAPRSLGELSIVNTLGSAESMETVAGVTVLSVQRVGVFDTTTISGQTPDAVITWLNRHGFHVPSNAKPVINSYVEDGWVFVASKTRRTHLVDGPAALHPLAFTFAADNPVYPTRLTALASNVCAIQLYVFGERGAAARGFTTICRDEIVRDGRSRKGTPQGGFRISNPEVAALIGNSAVGTKLFAKLTPQQMASDVKIRPAGSRSKGRSVYSHSGAAGIACNIAVPMAAFAWLFVGLSQGGWTVDNRWIRRWRWRALFAAVVLGALVYSALPKVEVISVTKSFEAAIQAGTRS